MIISGIRRRAEPDARPPFRLVEIPLNVGAGAGIISIDKERFFPEGTTADSSGTFYVGSMDQGLIYKASAVTKTAMPFITPDDTNNLVSVLGLYAHNASSTLWVCSSDAGNSQRKGTAPVALEVVRPRDRSAEGKLGLAGADHHSGARSHRQRFL